MLSLADLFASGLGDDPQALALTYRDQQYTFYELDQWSRQIANFLATDFAVGEGDVVMVFARKAPVIVPLAVAIWRLGAIYAPIDHKSTSDRVEVISSKLAPKCVVFADEEQHSQSSLGTGNVSNFSALEALLKSPLAGSSKQIAVNPQKTGTIIHTSGSTGEPKGVCLSHSSTINYFDNHNELLNFAPGCVSVNNGPFHFDVSIQDTFLPLYFGASVVMHNDLFVPSIMGKLIVENQVTHFIAVSSVLKLTADHPDFFQTVAQSKLRLIQTGGEVCDIDLINRCLEVPGMTVQYGYGPTECNSICMAYTINTPDYERISAFPIGRPFPGHKAVLIDENDVVITQANQSGILAVSGPQVMEGYFNRPAETDSVMFELDGDQYYVTGDWCHLNESGEYVYDGRKDAERKINGRRINMNEIRAAVLKQHDVDYAVVNTIELEGRTDIYCFVFSKQKDNSVLNEVIAGTKERLIDYMIPQFFAYSATLPTTSTMKANDAEIQAAMERAIRSAPTEQQIYLQF